MGLLATALSACTPSHLLQNDKQHQSVTLPSAQQTRSRWTEASLPVYYRSNSPLQLKVFALDTVPLAIDQARHGRVCPRLELVSITDIPKATVRYLKEDKMVEDHPWSTSDLWEVDACNTRYVVHLYDTLKQFRVEVIRSRPL